MNYNVGGTLHEDDPTYVKRKADNELFENLATGQFCYVLSSRQTGKSSLRVRTMSRLKQAGFACSVIDVSNDAVNEIKASQWYANLVSTLTHEFDLDFDVGSWYRQQDWFSPLSRFREFIESVLLAQVKENVVIFIDEIDSLLSLPFPTDDFFALIRACHNTRVDKPIYKRLTFCLLGVATPSDLIRDKKRTPFNIGKGIELTRFTFEEARGSLTQGLAKKVDNPEQVLSEVLNWTGGQPFLTQKVCQLVIDKAKSSQPDIKQLVQAYVIDNWENQDIPAHLGTIRDRLLADEKIAGRMLGLYEEILRNGSISADMSQEKVQLRLSGLVAKEDEKLVVYNLIYEKIFESKWIKEKLADLRSGEYASAFNAWVAGGQGDSLLLRGGTMEAALRWKEGRSLSAQDQDFIVRSQELDRQDKQKANQILKAANRKAQKRILLGSGVLGVSLVLSAIAGWGVLKANEARESAEQGAAAATQKANQEEAKAKEANEARESAERGAATATQKANQEEAKAKEANNKFAKAQVSLQETEGRLKSSQSELKNTNQQLTSTKSQLANTEQQKQQAEADLQQANQERDQALQETTQAEKSRDKAVKQAEEATKQQQKALTNLNITQIGTQLERVANKAIEDFESGKEIPALLEAMETGQTLKEIVDENQLSQLEDYPTTRPILAIQRILNEIHEQPLQAYTGGKIIRSQLSNDHQLIVTISEDGMARLWNTSGKLISELADHKSEVYYARFSPNSKKIITVDNNGIAQVHNIAGQVIAKLTKINQEIQGNKINFSPDSNLVTIIAKDNKNIHLLNTSNNKSWEINTGQNISKIKFSPDSQFLIIYEINNQGVLWNLDNEKLIRLKGNQGFYYGDFSPNSHLFAWKDKDEKTVWLEDLENKVRTKFENKGKVFLIDFSSNNKFLLMFQRDTGILKVVDIENKTINSFTGNQGIEGFEFNFDGSQIAAVDKDKTTLWILNTFNQKIIHKLERKKLSISIKFHPNQNLLLFEDDIGTFLWNTSNGSFKQVGANLKLNGTSFYKNDYILSGAGGDSLVIFNTNGDQVSKLPHHIDSKSLKIHPKNPNLIVSNDAGSRIRLLNLTTGEQIQESSIDGYFNYIEFSPDGDQLITIASGCCQVKILNLLNNLQTKIKGKNFNVIQISPDRNLIAINDPPYIRLFNILGEEIPPKSKTGDSRLLSMSFTFDNNYIAIFNPGVKYSSIRVTDIKKNKSKSKYLDLLTPLSLKFTPDDKVVGVITKEGKALLLKGLTDRSTEEIQEIELKSNSSPIKEIEFSPNSNWLITLDELGKAILWDIDGKKIAELFSNQEKTRSIKFNPDSNLIATINEQGQVVLWNTNGVITSKLSSKQETISAINFSPNGQLIITGSKDGQIRLWNTEGEQIGSIPFWKKGQTYSRVFIANNVPT
ncbi:MAG: hypothetical protein F6K31_05115 [Symploca sp. SIO2G7]|nr:hypothetical protein [Symploca sp. SIO2G7]